jgi:hypothetical protein
MELETDHKSGRRGLNGGPYRAVTSFFAVHSDRRKEIRDKARNSLSIGSA